MFLGVDMNLLDAQVGKTYTVNEIDAGNDLEMETFLFRLGCYSGEPITVVKRTANGCIVAVKDGRYSIDKMLASAILVQ